MRGIPPTVTGYLRPGDDYSLGGISVHVTYVLEHYLNVLDAIRTAGFGECRPRDPEGLEASALARAKSALTAADLEAELERTEKLHERVLRTLESYDDQVSRQAPVFFGDATDAYPTSALDVLGWLHGHYQEHVPQVGELVAEARGAIGTVVRFNDAFNRGDVDTVMALMTDDCVFENTFPAPDGERHEGQAAVRAFWERFFESTERPRFTAEEIFAAGDRVVSRWRFDWGEGAGAGHVRGVDVIRVREGKLAEKLAYVKG